MDLISSIFTYLIFLRKKYVTQTISYQDSIPVQSIRERLSSNLLKNYDPYLMPAIPNEGKHVNAHHTITRVSLNAKEAILDVRGKIEMVSNYVNVNNSVF